MGPRSSVVGTFSALCGLAMIVLALGVGTILQARIEARALRGAEQLARTYAALAVVPNLARADLDGPLLPAKEAALDAALARMAGAGIGVRHANVFGPDGATVHSDGPAPAGAAEGGDELRRALGGELVSDVDATSLEVYVPLRLAGGPAVDGVAELYLDYGPTAAAVDADTRAVQLLLAGGLAILFLALFAIVQRISRGLRHQAQHDTLTGLPNRTALYRRARRASARVRLRGGTAGLLLIDLDRFKEVNDTLGHDHGDRLLRDVAERLSGALRRGDTLARLGGDEFAVLLRGLPHRGAAVELALRLTSALERPFLVRGVTVQLGASVGVALCPDHGTDVTTLVRRADVAMYEAKREHESVRVYDPARDPYSPDRLRRVGELRHALQAGELVLHYQPKVALEDGSVTGVEALVRWQHPVHGLLAPAEFLPLAERTGLMGDLTRWVVDAALRQARAWQDAGLAVPIAVNLAAANILDAALPDVVAERLAHWDVPGERLTCELSEHTVMADPRRAHEVLRRLRALGVRLSLDDFGTGQSSLAYLKRLPLDEVKIDRAFVAGIVGDRNDMLIVRSTIDLARSLGLEVVAEGVEGADVMDSLRVLHCHEAQGFHLSHPLAPDALEAWLQGRAAQV